MPSGSHDGGTGVNPVEGPGDAGPGGPKLGRPPAETWGWAFTILAAGILTGPLVVGFKERSRPPSVIHK